MRQGESSRTWASARLSKREQVLPAGIWKMLYFNKSAPPWRSQGEQIYFIRAYEKYDLCRVAVTCRVAVWNRLRNVSVGKRVGVKEEMSKRVDRKVLKWFGYVQRMGDERLTKKVYNSEVVGERAVGATF